MEDSMNSSNSTDAVTPYEHIVGASIMFVISSYGVVINFFVFVTMGKSKKYKSSFYTFCRSKTISNILTCLAFLLWAVPCTFLNRYYLPQQVNVFWGQMAGSSWYLIGLFVNCAMAGNRFCATYFPMMFRASSRQTAYIVLSFCWIFGLLYFPPGFIISDCGYQFVVEIMGWIGPETPCSAVLNMLTFSTVCTVTFTTVCLNFLTFIKLFLQFRKTMTTNEKGTEKQTTRIAVKLFKQCVTQDILYLIDMFACNMAYKFCDSFWYQFVCFSLVWLSIHVLDGTVILLYNRDLLKKRILAKGSGFTDTVQRF